MDTSPHIPIEIIFSILSRLPAESVLRFKSVSKSWYQIITSDARFIRAHLQHSPLQFITHNKTTTYSIEESEGIFLINLDFISNKLGIDRFEKTLFINYDGVLGSQVEVQASCDGLLYFNLYRHPADCGVSGWVCNPLLGELISVPMPRKSYKGGVRGFYFHSSSNQYRLLRVSLEGSEFEIYSLGTKSWRSIPVAGSYDFVDSLPSVILNNALHWVGSDSNHDILVFHFVSEDFRLLDQPPGWSVSNYGMDHLMEMEGCLCFCRRKDGIEVWIIKDYYNVTEISWEKKYVIVPDMRVDNIYFMDGEIVLTHGHMGFTYYSRTHNSLRRVPHKLQDENSHDVYSPIMVYKKSLISLLGLDRTATNRTITMVTVKEFHDVTQDDRSNHVKRIRRPQNLSLPMMDFQKKKKKKKRRRC